MINGLRHIVNRAITLSNIQRYSRMHLFNRQNVAEHSFNVALILLTMLSGDTEKSYKEKFEILAAGILHDIEESVTGDVIAPIKDKLEGFGDVEADAAESILPHSLLMHWDGSRSQYEDYIHFADLIERSIFCQKEIELGNGEPELREVLKWDKEPLRDVAKKLGVWELAYEQCTD